MRGRAASRRASSCPGSQFRWPGGQVPYEIDPAMPDQQRVHDAIAHWEQQHRHPLHRCGRRPTPRASPTSCLHPRDRLLVAGGHARQRAAGHLDGHRLRRRPRHPRDRARRGPLARAEPRGPRPCSSRSTGRTSRPAGSTTSTSTSVDGDDVGRLRLRLDHALRAHGVHQQRAGHDHADQPGHRPDRAADGAERRATSTRWPRCTARPVRPAQEEPRRRWRAPEFKKIRDDGSVGKTRRRPAADQEAPRRRHTEAAVATTRSGQEAAGRRVRPRFKKVARRRAACPWPPSRGLPSDRCGGGLSPFLLATGHHADVGGPVPGPAASVRRMPSCGGAGRGRCGRRRGAPQRRRPPDRAHRGDLRAGPGPGGLRRRGRGHAVHRLTHVILLVSHDDDDHLAPVLAELDRIGSESVVVDTVGIPAAIAMSPRSTSPTATGGGSGSTTARGWTSTGCRLGVVAPRRCPRHPTPASRTRRRRRGRPTRPSRP